MFGHNIPMSPSRMPQIPERHLLVTSVFYTLQGEGRFAGRRCLFVRMTHCTLACTFCDTHFSHGDLLSFDQVYDKMLEAYHRFFMQRVPTDSLYSHSADYTKELPEKLLVVITGGEPRLQPHLFWFLQFLHSKGLETQIETSGTGSSVFANDTYVCFSPKVNEKTGKLIQTDGYIWDRADCIKFVVSANRDAYKYVPDEIESWKAAYGRPVYLSPMNEYLTQPVKLGADGTLEGRSEVDERISFWTPGLLDMKKNQANHEHCAELCLLKGYTMTLQSHLLASLP